jgi:phage N-6-adenine-methyltransferase
MSKMNPAKNHPQQVAKRQRTRLFGDVDQTDEIDDRRTPQNLFDELNNEFHFTVDVAASKDNAKLDRYYDLERSGLEVSWTGERVWCNPPFSDLRSWGS